MDVSYTLRNPGNVRLGARQMVEITDVFGRSVASHPGKVIQELLPGNAVRLHESFTGVPAEVRLGASVKVIPVEPVGTTEKAPASKTYTSHTWAIPWTVFLLLVLAFLLWRLYRRYRTRSEGLPPAGPGRSPGGAGSGGGGPTGVQREPESVLQYDGRAGGAPA
jgi:hypothetical protein